MYIGVKVVSFNQVIKKSVVGLVQAGMDRIPPPLNLAKTRAIARLDELFGMKLPAFSGIYVLGYFPPGDLKPLLN